MTPGQSHRVVLADDAVRFEPVDALPNRVTWTPELPQDGDWVGVDSVSAAPYASDGMAVCIRGP